MEKWLILIMKTTLKVSECLQKRFLLKFIRNAKFQSNFFNKPTSNSKAHKHNDEWSVFVSVLLSFFFLHNFRRVETNNVHSLFANRYDTRLSCICNIWVIFSDTLDKVQRRYVNASSLVATSNVLSIVCSVEYRLGWRRWCLRPRRKRYGTHFFYNVDQP